VGGLRDELLAHPAFPGDQERLGALGNRLHIGEEVQHRPVAGDNGGKRLRVTQLA